MPTTACIASLRFADETPYLSRTACRTSSEMDVPDWCDRMCNAFQMSSSRYSWVRFMTSIIHQRGRIRITERRKRPLRLEVRPGIGYNCARLLEASHEAAE